MPAFDSVCLDALVQLKCLTPYQAMICNEATPDALAVGPFVITDRIGGDRRMELFTARKIGDHNNNQLTVLTTPPAERDIVLERLQRGLARTRSLSLPHVVVPQAAQIDAERLVVLSSWPGGKSLDELLVRRGRFPVSVVIEIARQIAVALEGLERCGVLHGDLRLRQVRIDDAGRLSLTQPMILAALEPHLTIHTDIPPACYDGIAPELIDSGAERSLASEMYALGCLLWQLLAGRPPFTAADPLMKLAAHQTRRIEDIRQWSPETPPHLAGLIHQLTSPDPRQRPRGFAEIHSLLGRPRGHASPRLRRFVRAFQSAAPRSTQPDYEPTSKLRNVAAAAALLLAVLGG
ncbi:MAG: protein kinase, partial [Planctomycetaceae bacterium]|nr:protein kinase [Planctomycetaceae bacterium]